MKIQESRSWLPRFAKASCELWCDSRRSPNTQSGGVVSRWWDLSGKAHHLNASGTAKPGYTAVGLRGTPELLLDGVDDVMTAAFTLNQPTTLYIVFASVTYGTSGVHDILLDGSTAGSMVVGSLLSTSTAISAGSAVSDATHSVPNGTLTRMIATFNGASSSLNFIDSTGVERNTTGNVGANNAGGLTLGALANLTRFYNAKIKEVALWSAALSTQDTIQLKYYARRNHQLAA